MVMLDILLQFVVEFLRALLVDELSERVRGRIARKLRARDGRRVLLSVHLRNRDRLLNKLLAEISKDL
jgi:molybdopterin biosynthesis enzyme